MNTYKIIIATLFFSWGNIAQAISAKQFESILDTRSAPLISQYVKNGIEKNTAKLVGRYLALKGLELILNHFRRLDCDPILDHKRKKIIHRKSVYEIRHFIRSYLSDYQDKVISAGIDVDKLNLFSEKKFSKLSCN